MRPAAPVGTFYVGNTNRIPTRTSFYESDNTRASFLRQSFSLIVEKERPGRFHLGMGKTLSRWSVENAYERLSSEGTGTVQSSPNTYVRESWIVVSNSTLFRARLKVNEPAIDIIVRTYVHGHSQRKGTWQRWKEAQGEKDGCYSVRSQWEKVVGIGREHSFGWKEHLCDALTADCTAPVRYLYTAQTARPPIAKTSSPHGDLWDLVASLLVCRAFVLFHDFPIERLDRCFASIKRFGTQRLDIFMATHYR